MIVIIPFFCHQDLRIRPPGRQIWGELDLVPPKIGGLGGLIDGYCVSPAVLGLMQECHV